AAAVDSLRAGWVVQLFGCATARCRGVARGAVAGPLFSGANPRSLSISPTARGPGLKPGRAMSASRSGRNEATGPTPQKRLPVRADASGLTPTCCLARKRPLRNCLDVNRHQARDDFSAAPVVPGP